jgi:hypothetical protein
MLLKVFRSLSLFLSPFFVSFILLFRLFEESERESKILEESSIPQNLLLQPLAQDLQLPTHASPLETSFYYP